MNGPDSNRLVAEMDGGFVLYVNGLRLNRLRGVRKWFLAGRKFAKMLDELEDDPDSGFLGYQPILMGARTGAAIQYWRSLEDLVEFAHDPDGSHVPAWRWLDETFGDDGDVGIWAELYVIDEDDYETFFRDVEGYGLGRVATLVPASERPRRLGLSADRTPKNGDDREV